MWRFLFLMCAAAVLALAAGPASAEVIYIEDFEDENGDPAFDPMFSHNITASPYAPESLYWDWYDAPLSPERGKTLLLAPGQDAISFSLPPGQKIVYASVDALNWGGTGPAYSVDFIGRDGSLQILLQPPFIGWETIEVSCEQIGALREIEIRAGEAFFDNITIHVVPEPSVVVMTLAGLIVGSATMLVRLGGTDERG